MPSPSNTSELQDYASSKLDFDDGDIDDELDPAMKEELDRLDVSVKLFGLFIFSSFRKLTRMCIRKTIFLFPTDFEHYLIC